MVNSFEKYTHAKKNAMQIEQIKKRCKSKENESRKKLDQNSLVLKIEMKKTRLFV